jgi:hypothetical protein
MMSEMNLILDFDNPSPVWTHFSIIFYKINWFNNNTSEWSQWSTIDLLLTWSKPTKIKIS